VNLQPHQWKRLLLAAQQTVDATVRDLPTPLRQRAKQVPITFESTPGDDLLRDGVEADTLGLFVGSAFPDELANPDPLPAHILLFLENLWDYARHDAPTFREEVRRTLLHELGHYLGLDEDALADRDLD
jgi:predicted Zn-dependent protease with MMP-like domain